MHRSLYNTDIESLLSAFSEEVLRILPLDLREELAPQVYQLESDAISEALYQHDYGLEDEE